MTLEMTEKLRKAIRGELENAKGVKISPKRMHVKISKELFVPPYIANYNMISCESYSTYYKKQVRSHDIVPYITFSTDAPLSYHKDSIIADYENGTKFEECIIIRRKTYDEFMSMLKTNSQYYTRYICINKFAEFESVCQSDPCFEKYIENDKMITVYGMKRNDRYDDLITPYKCTDIEFIVLGNHRNKIVYMNIGRLDAMLEMYKKELLAGKYILTPIYNIAGGIYI